MRVKKMPFVVLSLCRLLSAFAPSMTVSAAIDYLIIYIEVFGCTLYPGNSKPTSESTIYPTGDDVGAIVREALKPCLMELAAGTVTGNYEKYAVGLYKALHLFTRTLC